MVDGVEVDVPADEEALIIAEWEWNKNNPPVQRKSLQEQLTEMQEKIAAA